ncbi:hypothetical protein [Flavobacterium praedii]|uniref:hypothetical protein n=1 Tax=Flavobacterium praedii TaxID=3002900 RepID=UPI002481ED28|nr:hypothetical protein [Flavobacterium praedii]
MEFRYHPIIEGLRINEDGTEIYYNEELLRITKNDTTRKHPTLKVSFAGRRHTVAKLVCETWNGLRAHTGLYASKIGCLSSNHYSNLEWKEGPNTGVQKFKQILSGADVEDIIARIEKGEAKRAIARIYKVDEANIRRIKRKHDQNN